MQNKSVEQALKLLKLFQEFALVWLLCAITIAIDQPN